MNRRYFPPEFKIEAASTVLDSGLSVRDARETFDVGPSVMRRWIRQLKQERAGGVDKASRPITPEQQRIRELEQHVRHELESPQPRASPPRWQRCFDA